MRERLFASLPEQMAKGTVEGHTLTGYASAFNYPIETIETALFGQKTYMMPGAFKRTLAQTPLDQIKVLFNHGFDPRYGKLPIGIPVDLHEDRTGLAAQAELHDGPDNANIIAALRQGSLNAMSIQFEVVDEDYSDDRSERYIREVKLFEFGPVTFPANLGATAQLNSADELVPLLRGEAHWDGAAAMRTCSSAAEFRKIAFERSNDSDPDTAAHWALPHHPNPMGAPGNADPAGVAAALAALHGGRGGPPDLKMSVSAVESHLQAHQSEASSVEARGDHARTLDEARLTWAVEASRHLEREDEELEAMEARIRMLKEAGWQPRGS